MSAADLVVGYVVITAVLAAVTSFVMTKKGSDFADVAVIGCVVMAWPVALICAVLLSPVWIPHLIAKHF